MTECMEVEDLNDFNDIFYRPPNFCSYCGELLDFEIIKEDQTQCQRCGGMTELNKVISHQIETTEYYDYSKEWMNKLKNKEDKLKAQQKVKRSTVSLLTYSLRSMRSVRNVDIIECISTQYNSDLQMKDRPSFTNVLNVRANIQQIIKSKILLYH